MKTKAVNYQAVYLWECPDCGTTWQMRARPRAGAQLVCAAAPEQRNVLWPITAACGSVNVSAGRRKGLAPNVTF